MKHYLNLSFQIHAERFGIKKGIEQGIQKGRAQERLRIAKIAGNLAHKGFSSQVIAEATGLSEDEIGVLQ